MSKTGRFRGQKLLKHLEKKGIVFCFVATTIHAICAVSATVFFLTCYIFIVDIILLLLLLLQPLFYLGTRIHDKKLKLYISGPIDKHFGQYCYRLYITVADIIIKTSVMPRIWLERCEPIESPRQTDEIRTRRGSSVLSGGYSTVWPRLQVVITSRTVHSMRVLEVGEFPV